MTTQQAQLTTFSAPQNRGQGNKLIKLLTRYLYHWPLFLLVLITALILAFAYTRTLKPGYEVRATLLIQDEKKTPEQQTALKELNLASSPKIIENEMEILKSRDLMESVVKELGLAVVYLKEGSFGTEDLYKRAPVKFSFVSPQRGSGVDEISIIIKDARTFLMETPEGEKEYPFSKKFSHESGSWMLSPEEDIKDFAGEKITIRVADSEATVLGYQARLDVGLLNKLGTAVLLSINDQVAERGTDVLNTLLKHYNLAAKAKKNEETQSTIDFIDKRLGSLSGELSDAEAGIEDFKSSRGLTDISADSKVSLENMQVNDRQLNEINVQISVVEGIERYITQNQGSGKVPATLGIDDPGLSSLIEKLSQLQLQREQLLATTPETNPDFEPINRQIKVTRAAIRENVRSMKASLLGTRNKLQSYNSRFESSIKDMPTQERQYISKKRQQASKENLYTYLLQKREEVSVSYASSLSNEHVVDQAYAVPARGLKKMMAFGLAFMLGLGLPAGVLFVRSSLRERILDMSEIREVVDVPVIGHIELADSKEPIVVNDRGANVVSEQIRLLRTKLYHLYKTVEGGRVTLITSSVSGEGKSFVSSNLAVAMAYSGRKTLIVELDLRKPKIAPVFNMAASHAGVSDYLKNTANAEDIIRKHPSIPGLDFIGSGSAIGNPAELLESSRLEYLFDSLRERYDEIIVDSPPVHLVPDGLILARLSDLTLYVIRQGFTEKAELNFIKELHEQNEIGEMRFVFNGISKIKFGYGFNYNYGYYDQGKKNTPLTFLFSNFSNRFVLD
jgi:capsular exopolysaccharide synthesis family protein